jgi:hypothetical protein
MKELRFLDHTTDKWESVDIDDIDRLQPTCNGITIIYLQWGTCWLATEPDYLSLSRDLNSLRREQKQDREGEWKGYRKDATNTFRDLFNHANQSHAIAYGALVIALIDKGIITREEYDRAYAQATSIIDQEFARKRDAQGEPE